MILLIFTLGERIAQSEAANGKPFAKYWLHNGFIMIDNEKMSKSAGNFFTVREIAAEFPYEVIRFFILNGHYRSPLNFSRELMQSCQNGLERIKNCNTDLKHYINNAPENGTVDENTEEITQFVIQFEKAMDDDFNTADAIAAIYELVRFINKNNKNNVSKQFAQKEMDVFEKLCNVLGINKEKEETKSDDDEAIEKLIAERTQAKKDKDFAKADSIRDKLSSMGITIKDTRHGVQWFRS